MLGKTRARVLVVGAIVLAMTFVSSSAAHADDVRYRSDKIDVSGYIEVVDDYTDWNLGAALKVTVPRGQCAFLRIDIDVNNSPDPTYTTPLFCLAGDGAYPWRETKHWWWTRGARLSLCWQDTGCQEIQYIRERR